jgi:hypothetical protein
MGHLVEVTPMPERNRLCGAELSAQTTDALIFQNYAEIGRYAVAKVGNHCLSR